MKTFGKQPSCPTSQEIFSCVAGSTSSFTRLKVEQHAQLCDFCGAELQLFSKHTPIDEDYMPAPTPALIKLLRVNLPAVKTPAVQRARAA